MVYDTAAAGEDVRGGRREGRGGKGREERGEGRGGRGGEGRRERGGERGEGGMLATSCILQVRNFLAATIVTCV